MLKLLSEEHDLILVFHIKDVIVGLVSLIELKDWCHFANQALRSLKVSLLCLVLHQSRLVHVQLPVSHLAPILEEIKQRVQVINLIEDVVSPINPQLAQWLGLDFISTLYRICFDDRVFRVKRCGCAVGCSLLKCSCSICCPWSLETQEIYPLLSIEALLHRIWPRFFGLFFLLLLFFLSLPKCFSHFGNWILLLHQLTHKKAFVKLGHRLQSTSNVLV